MKISKILVWASLHKQLGNISRTMLVNSTRRWCHDPSRLCWKLQLHNPKCHLRLSLEQQPSKTLHSFIIYKKFKKISLMKVLYQITWNMTQMVSIIFLKRYKMCWKLSTQFCKIVSILVMLLEQEQELQSIF